MATKELDIIVKLRDAASRGLKGVRKNVTGVGKASKVASKGLSSMYAQLVAIAGVVAGGALLGKAIKDFAAFDDNMRAAAAVTGATRKEMELMTETAKRMGKETRYTASQSAEALRFLGMAGFEANEAVAALPGTLELAAAGALDLGTAADITTNILSAFGLEVESLGRVNDVLVKTFTSANVNLTEIGEAFKMVGPIAKGVGANFEDLVATIGALGNAGIKGTLAGTALKNSIDALLAPTAKEEKLMNKFAQRIGQTSLNVRDAEGDFIGFSAVLKQLEASGIRGDEILQAFGMRAGPGLAALVNMGSESLDELIMKLDESGGTASDIAEQMEAGLGGQIRKTISILESLRLAIGDAFGPEVIIVLEHFRGYITGIINKVNELKENGTLKGWGEAVVEVFGWVNFAVSKTYHALSALTSLTIAAAAAVTGHFEIAKQAMDGFVKDVNNVFAEAKDPLAAEAGKVVGAITQEMYEELEASVKDSGPIGKGADKVNKTLASKIVDYPSIQATMKAAFIKLGADLKKEAEIIEGDYEKGLIKLDEYYEERADLVRRKIAAEIEILRSRLGAETNVDKKEILGAQIYAKQEQLNLELLKLDNDKAKEEKKLDDDKLKRQSKIDQLRIKAEKANADQAARIRAGEEGVTTLDTQYAKELADLQTKQNSELDAIRVYHAAILEEKRTLGAAELEIDKAIEAEKAAVREQQEGQAAEKTQLMADQALRLQEYKLNNLKTVAAGAAQVFDQLYQATGKKSKELFYLSKAAAIAEATINIAQGMTKALATGGVWGIAQGAMIAAAGAVQIAQITSQTLAEGGAVQGHSPHAKADNIPAMLTAEEFVQPVASVRHYGKAFMESIRNRSFPKMGYAEGGYVKSGTGRFAEGGLVRPPKGAKGEGGKAGTEITMINVQDPSELDQYLASASGQNAVLNVISSKSEAVRRILR